MQTYQYTIKGKPYQEIDMKESILSFLSKLDVKNITYKDTKAGFVLDVEADKDFFETFDRDLLTKLVTLIQIDSYSKKLHKNIKESAINEEKRSNDIFHTCIKLLARGEIIAIKEKNGFHILCNASKTKAVQTLREQINIPRKPLPVVFKNLLSIQKLVLLSKKEQDLTQSQNHPFVIAKIKNLHRLERDRYKYTLSAQINPINKRIEISLPFSDQYNQFFSEIAFPLISIDAKTEDGTMIIDKDTLVKTYGDIFKYILDSDITIKNPQPRVCYQILYGKAKQIKPETVIQTAQNSFDVILDNEQSTIANLHLSPIKILLDENNQQQPKYSALSLLFTNLPLDEILALDLPFNAVEIKQLHKNWENNINTQTTTSLLTLFDAIASLSNQLHTKTFDKESVFLAEAHFEVCEEDLLDYNIADNIIYIDIINAYLKNNKLKHLISRLLYTLSVIICEIAKEKNLGVTLNGTLLQYRDLTELIIEKLEDEGIACFY